MWLLLFLQLFILHHQEVKGLAYPLKYLNICTVIWQQNENFYLFSHISKQDSKNVVYKCILNHKHAEVKKLWILIYCIYIFHFVTIWQILKEDCAQATAATGYQQHNDSGHYKWSQIIKTYFIDIFSAERSINVSKPFLPFIFAEREQQTLTASCPTIH